MCTRYITPDRRAMEAYVSHVPSWWRQSFDVRITKAGETWLFGEVEEVRELVGPCPDAWLEAYPVARNLGDVPEQMEPAGAAGEAGGP
ncbi:MAG: hypothetical protein U5S82_03455 [Gammaproteobacteria bacterium]|nr:hypothetical protein [Gammaproteobacteria bacterium]